MNKFLLVNLSGALLLSACGAPRYPVTMNLFQMQTYRMAPRYQAYGYQTTGTVRGTLTPTRPKEESKLIPNRNITVPRSAFDDTVILNGQRKYPSDPIYKSTQARPPLTGGELPFVTYTDFRDYVRYGFSAVFEDYKYLDENTSRSHFSRYIGGAYREVQSLYKATREEMKRFILVDTLANSLRVDTQILAYTDTHNPPAQPYYKLSPTQAASIMPTFGELIAYNRSSYDVNYSSWDILAAARFYQTNYSRYFGLIMEFGPTKQDAWRTIHRDISQAATY